jgi:ribose 5-phosphate isomerase B
MRIAIGSDHAGFSLKESLAKWLLDRGMEVHDVGPHQMDPEDDYPDFARAVAEAVLNGSGDAGILICSTGIGSCIAANKVTGIRAALCHDVLSARRSRQHNDANVLCLGADIIGPALAQEVVSAWIESSFAGDERHRRRLAKVAGIEAPGASP